MSAHDFRIHIMRAFFAPRKRGKMNKKESNHKIAHEVLIFLICLALMLFITRIWALLFLVILGIFIAALRLLFKKAEKVEIITPIIVHEEPQRDTEKDILRRAFGLIQRRITEDVVSLHPSARWQWLLADSMGRIERDEPVAIILNGAGGYRKANVRIHNLVYIGLSFEMAPVAEVQHVLPAGNIQPVIDAVLDDDSIEIAAHEEPLNYEFLAFEWVEARLPELNERANETIGRGQNTLLISSSELPHRDSWDEICKQLTANEFAGAVAHEDGILITLQQ